MLKRNVDDADVEGTWIVSKRHHSPLRVRVPNPRATGLGPCEGDSN